MSYNSEWQSYRTVVEDLDVEQVVNDLKKAHERFADQWDGLCWLLARSPDKIATRRRTVNDKEFYLAHRKGDADYGLVDIAVLYTFDHNTVVVQAVEVFAASPDE